MLGIALDVGSSCRFEIVHWRLWSMLGGKGRRTRKGEDETDASDASESFLAPFRTFTTFIGPPANFEGGFHLEKALLVCCNVTIDICYGKSAKSVAS